MNTTKKSESVRFMTKGQVVIPVGPRGKRPPSAIRLAPDRGIEMLGRDLYVG
jgi:hypothetical protein